MTVILNSGVLPRYVHVFWVIALERTVKRVLKLKALSAKITM